MAAKKIEIVSRWDSTKVLYVAKGAADVRAAVEEAVRKGAYLGGAYLGGANLGDANLRGANLRGANLGGANLGGANDNPGHPLHQFRQDYWSILDQAPAEVAGLRKSIVAGKINGSAYEDDCGLGCLVGTIANVRGCTLDQLNEELGIPQRSSRPAEQWFIAIVKGDKPLPLDTDFKEQPESVFRASYALVWLDEWVKSRKAIAKALAPKKKPVRKAAKKKAAKS